MPCVALLQVVSPLLSLTSAMPADRRVRSARVPITAKVVADFLSSVGVDRVLTVDLHAEQIQGFFDVPVDNVFGSPILLEDMLQLNLDNPIVVSPDIGGVVRARAIAKLLNDTDMAIIDKRRPRANVSQVMHIIGDVAGRDCVMVDDMIDTGGTLCKAAEALKERGAKRVFAYATHPIFSGNAIQNIKNSVIDEFVVCDTIPLTPEIKALDKVRTPDPVRYAGRSDSSYQQRRIHFRYVRALIEPSRKPAAAGFVSGSYLYD